MKEDAVSPVIAFMLLLMIVVSFISVLNAYYIPSLKEQAEIQHLHSVEESFSKLSSDVLQILTFRQNITLKEQVELGGGDVLFSPLRSSGYLEVNTGMNEQSLSSLHVSVNSNLLFQSHVNRSLIVFRPVGNFWMNQGYEWEDGVLNITKGNRKTYLQYAEAPDNMASEERARYYEMMKPRVQIEKFEDNATMVNIDLISVFLQDEKRSSSGNGIGTVQIDLDKSSQGFSGSLDETTKIHFSFTGKEEENLSFKFVLNNTFSGTTAKNLNWTISGDNNFYLELPKENSALISDKKFAKIRINIWNLSFQVY